MMVVFVSECEKNALKKTRRVLDSFANRIGNNVWQTVITLEGLDAVKKQLRKTASKNTAVACHWLRSRSRAELYWVVGNRHKFNAQGQVPVHHTEKNLLNMQWENDWHYLPLIKSLTALAALLHDWGKANTHFQEKLKNKNKKISDPLRHEWVSYLLLNAFVDDAGNDAEWLERLAAGNIAAQKIITHVCNNKPRTDLPPTAQLISWLIITHHRLPFLKKDEAKKYCENKFTDFGKIFTIVKEDWGYRNKQAELAFQHGILAESKQWLRRLCKWANKMAEELHLVEDCLKDGSWRVVLHHARLAMMLGDHYYSSLDRDDKWKSDCKKLYANTYNIPQKFKNKWQPRMKQQLDEHLVGVMTDALPIACLLPKVESFFPTLPIDKSHRLQKRSVGKFSWQNKAVDKINKWQQQNTSKHQAVFAVNMASTGAGKTFANAKVMHALARDNLRYTLALGLRTLTLQTGDEYRERIGLGKDEMAVVIGSQAILELHESNKHKTTQQEELEAHIKAGSESQEELWDSELDCDGSAFIEEEFSKKLLRDKHREKHKNFLYAPVLVCTIDHIIAATETKRGGRYILPSLRLMSSDLVIDEIDDFSGSDMIAIGRLIHLAGMLGRKVMISSATIPPDLAEGYFNAYQQGWQLFCQTRDKSRQEADCVWIDEHDTKIERIGLDAKCCDNYRKLHTHYVNKRVKKLQTQPIRRRGEIITCDDIKDSSSDKNSKRDAYYERIKDTALELHARHSTVDSKTQKNVSFGVVRVANIEPCIELTRYLLETEWLSNTDVKIMAYHSRQVMLLRHEQEKHLDTVLKVKDRDKNFSVPIIRQHLDNSNAKDILFIVVATPVEEVGRDHDFDWAVVEPSSFRSIIQLAGRVRRHREGAINTANVALMQYNLKALHNKDDKPVFRRPGFEGYKDYKLSTHDLKKLLDETKITERIDATTRIIKHETLQSQERLADLEHKVIADALAGYDKVGPEALQGYLTQCWGLTALPQVLQPFREGANNINLFRIYDEDKDEFIFAEKDREGKPVPRENGYRIEHNDENFDSNKLWLQRDYRNILENIAEQKSLTLEQASLRYGELSLPLYLVRCYNEFIYSDQLGLGKK